MCSLCSQSIGEHSKVCCCSTQLPFVCAVKVVLCTSVLCTLVLCTFLFCVHTKYLRAQWCCKRVWRSLLENERKTQRRWRQTPALPTMLYPQAALPTACTSSALHYPQIGCTKAMLNPTHYNVLHTTTISRTGHCLLLQKSKL